MDNQVIELLTDIRDLLNLQAGSLAPNYKYSLASYTNFNWRHISASVEGKDPSGVTAVRWHGHLWTRRSGTGKYGRAIWFSRAEGRDESGETQYLRLITFKELADAEPLPPQLAPEPAHDNGRDQVTAPIAKDDEPPKVFARGEIVKVQGQQATKEAIVNYHDGGEFISVSIDGKALTISRDRVVA